MREFTISFDCKKRGIDPVLPPSGELGITRLMNMRPDKDGLHFEYRPTDSNSTLITAGAVAAQHVMIPLYDNDASTGASSNTLSVLHNRGGTWALASRTFEIVQTTTPPSITLGTQSDLATFTKNGLKPPCVISAEGVHLISDGFTTYELSAIDSIPSRLNPTDVPGFLCGCYYNGQFVVGNIPTWSVKTGNSQSMIAWSDIGNTNFVAGTESVRNTCTDQAALTYSTTQILSTDNTIGFAQLPPTAEIVGMHVIGNKIGVFTTDGIYAMVPVENGWGISLVSRNQCIASCKGDASTIFIDKANNSLYSVSNEFEITELDYTHIFGVAPNARYQLRYFPSRKAYQIYQFWWDAEADTVPDWESNFLLVADGLYQTDYKILVDEHIPKFQKYVTYADVLRKDTDNFSSRFLMTAPLRNNYWQSSMLGIGPTTFGSPDFTNLRMMRIVGRESVTRAAGALTNITWLYSNKNVPRHISNVDYYISQSKINLMRDMITYPRFSGKLIYIQLIGLQGGRSGHEDIVIDSIEMTLVHEGAQHRRGRLVNTTNT